MDKTKENFMESPLIVWLMTFDDAGTLKSVEDVADGLVLNKVMTAVDPDKFPPSNVVRNRTGTVQGRFENLQLLINRIVEFYQSSLQHLVVSSLPDVSLIAQDPENNQSLDELEKLVTLLLGCVVQCDNKGPLIENMKLMDVSDQHAIVAYIQQVTETTDYVCSYDWTSFRDITKENVEALCQAAFHHLFHVSSERHRLHKLITEITLERNYFRDTQQMGLSGADMVSPMMAKQLSLTPSPQINPEMVELRTKVRNLQEQLDRKVDTLAENSQQLDQAKSMIQKLQQEKRDLFEKLHSQQIYMDEYETLQAQASKCERLEGEVQRYKKKAEDAEYMKKRIEELINQNELMVETKALLEEKAASLATRAEALDELQSENARLKVQLESLNQEKEIDIKRMEEFISYSARLQRENTSLHEKISDLEVRLEEEQERVNNESFTAGDINLSLQIKEADMANKTKLARLEKESIELERSREELRTANAKVAELEKSNKKLSEQAHTDKKTIIKVNEEVEMLKVKASRAEKLHLELNAQKEKFEEVEVLRGKVKDWKVRNEQVMEFKAKLEDEVEILRSKAAQYEEVVMENTQLKVQNSTLTREIDEEKSRSAEIMSKNAQLEMENERSAEEVGVLSSQLQQLRSKQPVSMPTIISPPRVSESEMAAKVKLQRLEKEQKEMEKSLESLRQAKAKAEEVEKTNKKLNDQAHEYRMVIVKLKEELQDVKRKASMLDTSQAEVKLLRQQSEGSELAKKQIKELKQQINLIIESKAIVEDERSVLQSKLENVSSWEDDRDSLRGKIEALELEQDNSSRRLQELLEANAQLEIDRDRKEIEIKDLMEEIERAKYPPVVPESPKGIMSSVGFVENSTKATAIEREEVMSAQMRKLEREKEELKGALNSLKKNNAAAQEELAKGNRKLTAELETVKKENIRIKEELKREQGQKTNLTQNLAKVKEDYRKSMMFMDVGPDWEEKMKEDKTKETRRIEEIELRMNQAYQKTLKAKEERIGELEKRLEEQELTNGKLREEVVAMKKLSKVQRVSSSPMSSPKVPRDHRFSMHGGESPLQLVSTVGPSELGKLKEKAAECDRVKEQMEALKDDNQNLVAEVMDSRAMIQDMEASNIRLQDRFNMSEQLNRTLEEENRTLLHEINKLLEKNQSLLVKTLESKDAYIEEERSFKNRVDALESQKVRLQQELELRKKEAVMRELELFRKQQKKPGILKRGLAKIKGKISHRQSIQSSQVAIDGFSQGRSSTFLTSGSHSSYGGLNKQDSNMSSDEQQSLSSSTGPSENDLRDPTLFIPKMNSSPRTSNKDKSMSLPRGTSSGLSPRVGDTSKSSDVMTLEDFLTESDKTPKSKRKYIELSKAVSSYTPGHTSALANTSQRSYTSHASMKSTLEPRSEVVDIPEFLKTGGSPGQRPGRHRASSDAKDLSHSQLSFSSSRRDSDNFSNVSSASLHSSSRSSDINRVGDTNTMGLVHNSNNNNNNHEKKGQFVIYPAAFHRERAHTIESSMQRRVTEPSYPQKPPPGKSSTLRVPIRDYHSSGSLPKSKSIEELQHSSQKIKLKRDRGRTGGRLQRAASGDILTYNGDSPSRRRYSEIPTSDGRMIKRWSSGDILDDCRRSMSSLAALTNIDQEEKEKLTARVSEDGTICSTVHLDLNSSVGSANTTWYDYGAV